MLVDVDDTIIEVHGYAKQGAGFGYSKVRGLNALLATVTTAGTAPVVVAQRLRKGSCGSPRGAKRLVADALKTVSKLHGRSQVKPLLRADSAFYGAPTVGAAVRGGAEVSVTVRMDPKVKAAIATINDDAWTPIEYTDAIFDEASNTWVSRAEVAEVPFTAFSSKKATEQVPGRLVVRRIPDLNAEKKAAGQGTLFDTWRFHAFFTTTDPADLDTVTADKTHRGHAIIEQVHADLKSSALAHLPSGKFTANAAWLVLAVIAFNLTRTAATISGTDLAKATTATIRRKLITIPARVASSARRITLHLPTAWPWETAWTRLFTHGCGPPDTAHVLTTQPSRRDRKLEVEHPDSEVRGSAAPCGHDHRPESSSAHVTTRSVDRGLGLHGEDVAVWVVEPRDPSAVRCGPDPAVVLFHAVVAGEGDTGRGQPVHLGLQVGNGPAEDRVGGCAGLLDDGDAELACVVSWTRANGRASTRLRPRVSA